MPAVYLALSSCSVEIRRSKTMRSVLTSVQPFTPVTSVAFEASPVPEGMMLTLNILLHGEYSHQYCWLYFHHLQGQVCHIHFAPAPELCRLSPVQKCHDYWHLTRILKRR